MAVNTFYSPKALLTQGQSLQGLLDFVSNDHPGYDLNGWFYYGTLSPKGKRGAFLVAIQRLNISLPNLPFKVNIVPSIIAYNNIDLGEYRFGGIVGNVFDYIVIPNPWQVIVDDGINQIIFKLISGTYGLPGAKIQLLANVVDQKGERLTADIIIEDIQGFKLQGFGPNSMYPQWLFCDEVKQIKKGKLSKYLQKTKDPLTDQGSYYYTQNRLDVLNYTINVGERKFIDNQGTLWGDYVAQSYDKLAQRVIVGIHWFFSHLQFNDGTSMTILQVITTSTPTYRLVNYYKHNKYFPSRRWYGKYVMLKALCSRDDVFPNQFKIKLINKKSKTNGTIIIVPALNNQIVSNGKMSQYEGSMDVYARIKGKIKKGLAWVEIK